MHSNFTMHEDACYHSILVGNRVGEADNPGPCEQLCVGCFNPHQLLGHEETVNQWGKGIWAAAETSHTVSARALSSARFKKLGFHAAWSTPVPCHHNNSGSLRGKAGGTSIISHLPLKPYPGQLPTAVLASSRFNDAIVDLGHGNHMYIANVYGPTHNASHYEPWAILAELCSCAFERAHSFRGPAMVTGDFNVDIDEVPHWKCMLKRGWIDAAAFHAQKHAMMPKPTSRGEARKSFILINSVLLSALEMCDVHETFEFDTHPLLVAKFDIETCCRPRRIWNLPSNTDGTFFDDDLMRDAVSEHIDNRRSKFELAMTTGDSDEALRQINLVFEAAMQCSAVDTEGHRVPLPQRCLGRSRKSISKLQMPTGPVIHKARSGEFTPDVAQPSKRIRQWTKQVRRLHSCARQIRAYGHGNEHTHGPIVQLWDAICTAPGFPGKFPAFCLQMMQLFIPREYPDADYVKYIGDMLKVELQREIAEWKSQVHEHRLQSIRRDFISGGSKAFHAVRDPPVPPFQAIETSISVVVRPMRWAKTGIRKLLLLGDPSIFDHEYPVYFQQQEAFIVNAGDDFVVLDRGVVNRGHSDMSLTQKRIQADMPTLHAETAAAWSDLWQREPADDALDQWPEVLQGLTCLADVESLEYQPLQWEQWKKHAATTKHRSARGSCAYTPRELVLMPLALTRWLLQLMSAIEHGQMAWPSSIMTARVTMLGKTDDMPKNPLQLRPITITSRLYRTWAKYRSMQVFKHFRDMLPPEIAGTAAGVSADMLAAFVADEVEDAIHSGLHRVGLTVDLIKCYNQVPRLPVLAVMRQLGVPKQYLTAVWSMFQQLDRVIEISGELGDGMRSTTGIPEGCCFSIVAMLSLTAWASQLIQHYHPDVEVLAYADNWAFFTDCVDKMQSMIETLQCFVKSLKMNIAPDKSWVWATHSSDRRRLKHVKLQGQSIPMKLFSTELGCDVTYCKRISKKQCRKRLAKATRVLRRVATRKLPKRYRVRMANQLAGSIAGYGSELVYLTLGELRGLRSATCQASGRSRGGVNPFLALSVPGDATDPEFALLVRKCRFWKRYLKAFPYRREAFFQKLASPTTAKHSGPASVFRKTLEDHGWDCGENGLVQHRLGWQFNWYYSSRSYVYKMLRAAWHARVCVNVQKRKGFALDNIDVAAFATATSRLAPSVRQDAVNYAIGKHVTNDALGHYVSVGNFACPMCDGQDSRRHRIFHCPALQSVRDKYSGVLDWLDNMPDTVVDFGILPWDDQWLTHSCCYYQPFPVIRRPVCDEDAEQVHVFTDGSASYTACFSSTVCAGAWVQTDGHLGHTIVATGGSVLDGGDHSAYRGEVWALCLALQQFCRVCIYTDCAALIDACTHLLLARATGSQPQFGDHEDLWCMIWELILTRPPGYIKLVKVRAHQQLQGMTDPFLRWVTIMNDKVDRLAKSYVDKFCVGCKRQLKKFCDDRVSNTAQLQSFYKMWGAMNEVAMTAIKRTTTRRSGEMPHLPLRIDDTQLTPLQCEIPKGALSGCLYGDVFIQRVMQYFSGLEWDFSQMPVSLLELYIDFTMCTGTLAPVLLTRQSLGLTAGPKVYRLKDKNVVADMTYCDLQNQSRVWQRAIKWLLQHWVHCPWSQLSKTSSLARYGYAVDQNGLAGQPKFRCGTSVCTQLWNVFHTTEGVRRSLSRRWAVTAAAATGGA
eukprot:Skav235038  [mRNA]  locus=scaffold287:164274:169313:+ [translate_table: standard]